MGFEKYIPIVEEAIRHLGINPSNARANTDDLSWSFQRGSAQIQMFLRTSLSHVGKKNTLVITSDIMPVPKEQNKQSELFTMLLSYNYQFVNESFSVNDNTVVLSTARYTEGLDAIEVVALLDSLSVIADSLDQDLIEQFG